MKKLRLVFLFFVSLCFLTCANKSNDVFDGWRAGKIVSLNDVKHHGIDQCFQSIAISDAVFKRIYGNSFKENCTLSRDDLRYLKVLHINFKGQITLGEIICNKIISEKLLDIFRVLYDNKYPIERIQLIDDYGAQDEPSMIANNSSAFNFRFVAGTQKLSNHSYGLAMDINPLYNPYVKERKDGSLYVSPVEATPYVDRNGTSPYMIRKGDLCYREFIKHGFKWGGDWTSLKDYQHFEYHQQ